MPRKDRPVIYRNLTESPYRIIVEGITFHFSSILHMCKFKDELQYYTEALENRIFNRYGIEVHFPIFCALAFYRQIETRGFLVYNKDGRLVRCPKLRLYGNPESVSE